MMTLGHGIFPYMVIENTMDTPPTSNNAVVMLHFTNCVGRLHGPLPVWLCVSDGLEPVELPGDIY